MRESRFSPQALDNKAIKSLRLFLKARKLAQDPSQLESLVNAAQYLSRSLIGIPTNEEQILKSLQMSHGLDAGVVSESELETLALYVLAHQRKATFDPEWQK
jgi:hypothetical protein